MDKQTSEMSASEIIDHFFEYHKNIGSKSYLRMKTSDNISYFRSSIIEKIDEILESSSIMERAVAGYLEVEQENDYDVAYDSIVMDLLDVKSMFYRLDEIIEEMTDSIWSDVKRRGVDMDWALGTAEYCAGRDGFPEYFYEAMSNLDLG